MHIFFLDLFTDIDAISPIIYKLNKNKNNQVVVCSTNYIQNNKNNDLIKQLEKEGVKYFNFPIKKFSLILFQTLLKILSLLPQIILKKLRFLFKFFYRNFAFFNREEIINFLKKNNAKTVSIDSSNPPVKLKIISEACSHLKIDLIFVPSGAEIINVKIFNTSKDLELCTYYLSQNKLEKFKIPERIMKSKIRFLGSPRYCDEWLSHLKKIYKKKFNKRNNKINLGLFVTPLGQNFSKHNSAIKDLTKDKMLNLKIRNKPRDYMLEKCCAYLKDELNTPEIINWADIIITVQSSVIIEAIKKNKIIFFLEYLIPNSYGKWLRQFKCVQIIKSKNELLKKIEEVKNNKYSFKVKNKKSYLKLVVGNDYKYNKVLDRYAKFYNNIC